MRNKVLIIESNTHKRSLLTRILTEGSYFVIAAIDAEKALERIVNSNPDLIICSQHLPGMSGTQFASFLRSDKRFKNIPLIMISEPCPVQEVISFLNAGVDEHLFYGTDSEELLARIRALVRRIYLAQETTVFYEYDGLTLNIDERCVTVYNHPIVLTRKEFDLLRMLISQPNKVLAIQTLLSSIWGYSKDISTKTLQVHISRLRNKLGPVAQSVKNFPGIGYAFSTNHNSNIKKLIGDKNCQKVS